MTTQPAEVVYVRLSLMQPKAGHEQDVDRIEDDLLRFFTKQPGFLRGYRITEGDPEGRLGRVTIWRSYHDADRAAQTDHVLAMRSELNLVVEEESHLELSWGARVVEASRA